MQAHTSTEKRLSRTRNDTAYSVERIVINLAAGKSMQPSGLGKEAAEKQNAQNHDDGDYDDLDQTHNESLKVRENKGTRTGRILKLSGVPVNEDMRNLAGKIGQVLH
jgi:hypothetical protein